jgi:SAM-dependent methyltransferase
MSGFSPDWLALREPADHRSRNSQLAEALKSFFLQRESVRVVDLGCGTGSNLRATAALLPASQTWTLVDYDAALLEAARERLSIWADTAKPHDGGLSLSWQGRAIAVHFRQADLVTGLDEVLKHAPDLVTASALFDLASEAFIGRFAKSVARTKAAFYTVLTYNGIQRWTPRSPLDQQMVSAFIGHQMTDKGFGISAGPTAPEHLAGAFRGYGYLVSEGDSPWVLKAPTDSALVSELATGFAAAVRETGKVAVSDIDKWLARLPTGGEVGHTDTLAIPGPGVIADFGEGD